MNHSLSAWFTEDHCPNWTCPSCKSTSLAILPGSFKHLALPESVARWQTVEGEWDDLELVFCCMLQCERSACTAVVAVSGKGEVIPNDGSDESDSEPYTEYFQAKLFTPILPAFNIPAACPARVAAPLIQSFSLFLNAPAAAANTIRISLEELMNALEMPCERSLHHRISKMPDRYGEHKEALMAIKLLGNAGSHVLDSVSTSDIEQAYTVIEFVLRKLYEGSTESVRQLTERIAARFAP